jgi:YfiH family protein
MSELPTIIRPAIFDEFPEIVAAQSTRLGGVSPEPFGMNLSSHVGDDPYSVAQNRELFLSSINWPLTSQVVYQNQIHSSNITQVNGDEGVVRESDGLLTERPKVLLAVSVADCTPVLLYDPVTKIIAAVHAGWRGTEQMITLQTIKRMRDLGAKPENIRAFIGASASGERYEVGLEVATLFDKRVIKELGNQKFLLDVKAANLEQLHYHGIKDTNIEVSPLCTIGEPILHSFRRDGKRSGRMLAVIGRKKKYNPSLD